MGGGVNRNMAEAVNRCRMASDHRYGGDRSWRIHLRILPTDLSRPALASFHSFAPADYFTGPGIGTAVRVRCAPKLLMLPADDRPPSGRQAARCRGPLHSLSRDRNAVQYHYDVSNDFFSLWLDRRMVYSTGYFSDPREDLDTAQERKLEYICRKLRLQRGERLLDIGCGWGGLVTYAAKTRDVEAVGITLTRLQAELAGQRILEEGLENRCRVEVLDYREVEDPSGYDKIASIGMFEHVGESRLEEYFGRTWRLLRPGGVFLNHGIAAGTSDAPRRGPSFFFKYTAPAEIHALTLHAPLPT